MPVMVVVDGGTVAGKSLEKDLNMKVVHLVAEQLRQERGPGRVIPGRGILPKA